MTAATATLVDRLSEQVLTLGRAIMVQHRSTHMYDFIVLDDSFHEVEFLGRYDDAETVQRAIGWLETTCGQAERFDALSDGRRYLAQGGIGPAEYADDPAWHQANQRFYNLAHTA